MLPGTSALLGMTVSLGIRGLAVVAAAGACMISPSQAQAQAALAFDERVGEVEGWRIGYSKALAGCFAAATFTDKTTVWLGYGAKLQFYLAFTNTGWRSIETGKTYQILVNAQGYGRWNGKFLGFARGDERGVIIANLKEKFLLDLARAGGMTVNADQKRIAQLSLAGSRSAIAEILTCQRARVEQAKADAAAIPPDKKETRSSSGTGFFVSPEGHVLTNYHVAGNCKTVTVMQPGLPAQEAKVVARDQRNDLTLLLTSFKPEAVPAFRKPVRLGESVAVYGFPLAGVLASGGNFTLGNITALAGLADDSTQFQISAPVQPGNSGGPLLDKHGNAVGVIVAKLNVLSVAKVTNDVAQNVNFAIKATTAVNFLETNGLTPPGGESTADLDPADLADKATKFTVKVNCN
jgi:S1-C subfamily serine protease